MRRAILRWIGRFVLVIGSPLLLFGVLELGAWAIGIEPLAGNTNYQGRSRIRTCRWGPQATELVCRADRYRSPGPKTVLAYGASSLVWKKTGRNQKLTNFTERFLDEVRPGEYRVWNLGSACKDSVFIRRCVNLTIDAEPDVIVLYAGHNDFSGFMGPWPRSVMWISEWGHWLLKLDHALSSTRTYSLVNRRSGLPITMGDQPRARMTPEEIADAEDVILDAYTANVTRIIEQAAERDAAVVLATLVSNLYEYPTRQKWWWSVLRQAAREGENASPWQSAYAEGIRLYQDGQYQAALSQFKRARDADPRTRAPSVLNERIREIAAAHEHVYLVDFEAELDAIGAPEGIGCNFFGNDDYCDGIHPNERTNRLLGEALARTILEIDR